MKNSGTSRHTYVVGREQFAIIPVRHVGRVISGFVILLVLGWLAFEVAKNPDFQFGVVTNYLFNPVVLRGVGLTLLLTVAAMTLGLFLGLIAAVSRLSPNPVLRRVSAGYIWFFRGTPVLVQLIFWFNIGILFKNVTIGIPFTYIVFWSIPTNQLVTPLMAAILGLGLNSGAYIAEIIRAGILSVAKGQVDAAYSIGMTSAQAMRRIVLPQAVPIAIPPLGNEFIGLLKYSALASVIAVQELLGSVENLYSTNFRTLELLVVASIWYLAVTSILTLGQQGLERKFSRGRAQAVRKRSSHWFRRSSRVTSSS